MKPNELMVGDWVLDGTQIAQITSITCGGVIETTVNEISNIEVIEPIRITLENLNNNGFNVDDHKVELWDSYMLLRFTVEWFNGEFQSIQGIAFNKFSRISYIHELQHLLRLLKINKEIVL